ncbi:hypothetical protein COLO4_16990 [Corchorus olitorius]|uniref:Uncharacterized protein n=1 Tax=Corchorus olitorius TaxID=93759 RepID=A0A1R3JEP3_9ROSI|nr:hypothetical protein COLO4_16990 [Corchorus olitorius]
MKNTGFQIAVRYRGRYFAVAAASATAFHEKSVGLPYHDRSAVLRP